MREVEPLLFDLFRKYIYELTGIHLKDTKRVFLANRIYKRLKELGLSSYAMYWNYLRSHPEEVEEFINAVTTNESHFFRTVQHFIILKNEIFPKFLKKNCLPLVWSAGCASGEEPYSIAILMLESFPEIKGHPIIASDISTEMLKMAQKGIYPVRRVETPNLPEEFKQLINKYFIKQNGQYVISKRVKEMVIFKKHNLVKDPPMPISFDIIFCRNTLIYFDKESQKKALSVIHKSLKPEGFLFLGHAETLIGFYDMFEPIKSYDAFYYRKKTYP